MAVAGAVKLTEALRRRFMAKVNVAGPDDCWPWTGEQHPRGYGIVTAEGGPRYAHRVAWAFKHGRWPRRHVRHTRSTA